MKEKTTAKTSQTGSPRLYFIDNLRWLMIVFVVSVHAAVTYSNLGSWYYTEARTLGRPTMMFFAMFESFLQAFFMGFLFLIAGYFVPGAFDRKGPRKFLLDRAVRLGIPTLIYALLIHPFNVYYLLSFQRTSPGRPFWTSWAAYVTDARVFGGTGPLWFALALLIFSYAYALVRIATKQREQVLPEGRIPGHRDLALLALGIFFFAFAIRLVQPMGTSFFNMQLCFFSQYIVLFIVGIQAFRNNWLIRIPHQLGMFWLRLALIGGTLFWLALMLSGGSDPLVYTGGWRWPSVGYALWESFFCVGICIGLIALSHEKHNHQGRFEKFMSANAFAVYVFHAPVVIVLALGLRNVQAPPFIKFVVLTLSSLTITFLGCHFVVRRIPGLNRVL